MKNYFFINGGDQVHAEGCCEQNQTTGELPIGVEGLALLSTRPIVTSFAPSKNTKQRRFLKHNKIEVGDRFFFGIVPQEHLLKGFVHANFGAIQNTLLENERQSAANNTAGHPDGISRLFNIVNRHKVEGFTGYPEENKYPKADGLKYKIVFNWVKEQNAHNCNGCYDSPEVKFITDAEAIALGGTALPSVATVFNAEVDKPKTWNTSEVFTPFGMAVAIGIEFTALPQESVNGVLQNVKYLNNYDFEAEIGFLVNDMRTNLTGQ